LDFSGRSGRSKKQGRRRSMTPGGLALPGH
jgi:hypothetical protein